MQRSLVTSIEFLSTHTALEVALNLNNHVIMHLSENIKREKIVPSKVTSYASDGGDSHSRRVSLGTPRKSSVRLSLVFLLYQD